ncbi:MAG: FtsX-like permease family protein [Bacteroidota bacterium]
MLIQIAWRNVWRSKVRSLVVITSITLGLMLSIFLMSFNFGMLEQRERNIITTQISHLQIHHPGFKGDPKLKYTIGEGAATLDQLADQSSIKAFAGRVITTGFASTTKGAFGAQIIGVQPEKEAVLTLLEERVIAGGYFPNGRKNTILIGDALAEKLGYKIPAAEGDTAPTYNFRKRLILSFQDLNGQPISARFRVGGVYKATNSILEKTQIFVQATDLKRETGVSGWHEIAVLMKDPKDIPVLKQELISANPQQLVQDYGEVSPDLKFIADTFATTMYIFIGIILLALGFGIVNTMLMAILERTRELGMLMSIGMNRIKIFLMVLLETTFMCMVGGPIGILLGYMLVSIFNRVGIDLSAFSEGMGSFDISSQVYTYVPAEWYWQIGLMVIITAFIASLYPARRALKLKPAEAVRAI